MLVLVLVARDGHRCHHRSARPIGFVVIGASGFGGRIASIWIQPERPHPPKERTYQQQPEKTPETNVRRFGFEQQQ